VTVYEFKDVKNIWSVHSYGNKKVSRKIESFIDIKEEDGKDCKE